jgi:hypothetical protein
MEGADVLLFEDETVLRLFPSMRRAWSMHGEQQAVAISGRNDQRVLFGTINVRTVHRVLLVQRNMGQTGFQALLRQVHRVYKGRCVWMILDNATAHKAKASLALAAKLHIKLLWLPKQCAELNAMDHLWRDLKKDISSNYQYDNIEEHVLSALNYIKGLSNKQARLKAGILSDNFWLKTFW